MKKLVILVIILFFTPYYCMPVKNSDKQNTVETNQIQEPISQIKLLVGYWFIPHNADINITFNEDGTFVFNDFNTKLLKSEVLKGKYKLNGNKLILIYTDRPKQTFNFYKGANEDDNYYIKKELTIL